MRDRLFGPADGTLLGALGAITAANAGAVIFVPGALGYPRGGMFLIDALPVFALAALAGAALAIPMLLVSGARFGLLTGALFVLGLAALALIDAWLWVACVSSV